MARDTRRNRISVNVEDSVNEAMCALADREDVTVSELARSMFITELVRVGLLPDTTLRRLAGVREAI